MTFKIISLVGLEQKKELKQVIMYLYQAFHVF